MYSTFSISYSVEPLGVSTLTISPSSFPIICFAKGAAKDIFPNFVSASSSPTILYCADWSESEFITVTVVPKITLSEGSIWRISIIWELLNLVSMSLILASANPCCSLAAWYSAFSFKSPNSLAVAIASIILGLSSFFSLFNSSPTIVLVRI